MGLRPNLTMPHTTILHLNQIILPFRNIDIGGWSAMNSLYLTLMTSPEVI
jgi:hypothetical protein